MKLRVVVERWMASEVGLPHLHEQSGDKKAGLVDDRLNLENYRKGKILQLYKSCLGLR